MLNPFVFIFKGREEKKRGREGGRKGGKERGKGEEVKMEKEKK